MCKIKTINTGSSVDMTGVRFGRWIALERKNCEYAKSKRKYVAYKCMCDCGNIGIVAATALRAGRSRSCGCLRKETIRKAIKCNVTHGKSDTRNYRIWQKMKERCGNPSHVAYARYGRMGIGVCKEWSEDYQTFYNWSISNGYTEQLTLDRIDNSKGYSPNNCRWVDRKTQVRNRKITKMITLNGVEKPLAEWAEEYGVPRKTIWKRLKRGWVAEDAITIRPGEVRSYKTEVLGKWI